MKKIIPTLILCGSISFASQEDGSIYYGAEPGSSTLKTHVFLCRTGNARSSSMPEGCADKFANDNECGCLSCTSASDNSRIGLALAFMRVDTMGRNPGEYLKITADTRNILWSAFMSFSFFSPKDYHALPMECCEKARKVFAKAPGKLSFKYAYNIHKYKPDPKGGFKITHTGPRLVDSDDYPHNKFLDSNINVHEFIDDLHSGLHPGDANEMHHLKRFLRNVVYGWTIGESTIPAVLKKIGEVCPLDEHGRRTLPEYNYAGSRGYNCAKFCIEVLNKFGVFQYTLPPAPKSLWKRMLLPGIEIAAGVLEFAAAMASGPVGLVVYSVFSGIYFGAAIGTTASEIDEEKEAAIIPNKVLGNILDFYKFTHEHGGSTHEFFIFAHNPEERGEARTAAMGENSYMSTEQKDHYRRFLVKSLDDALQCNLTVDAKKTDVFYTTIFEGRR